MNGPIPFRWLAVDDDPVWRDLLNEAAKFVEIVPPVLTENRRATSKALAERPVHLLSIDQNIPDKAGEQTVSTNGISLLIDVVENRPFVRTLIYTAFGNLDDENTTSRLRGTEYKQKAVGTKNSNSLTPIEYVRLIGSLLYGGNRTDLPQWDPRREEHGYITWALQQGRTHLPPVLAGHCNDLFPNKNGKPDWNHVARSLSLLREQSLYLAWAQACALFRAFIPPSIGFTLSIPGNSSRDIEHHLREVWAALHKNGHLGSWTPYITERSADGHWGAPGAAYLDGTKALPEDCKRASDGERLLPTGINRDAGAALALIDALAFWADRPLMAAPNIHPDDPRRLQFDKVVGLERFPRADVPSRARPPGNSAQRRSRIFALHETGTAENRQAEQHLISLYPLISLKEESGKTAIPCMLTPNGPGNEPIRVSLVDFTPLDIPLDTDEIAGWTALFA